MASSISAATISTFTRCVAPSKECGHGEGAGRKERGREHMDHFLNQSDTVPTLEPLPAGTAVGTYVLARLINSGPGNNTYLGYTSTEPGRTYQVIEYLAG